MERFKYWCVAVLLFAVCLLLRRTRSPKTRCLPSVGVSGVVIAFRNNVWASKNIAPADSNCEIWDSPSGRNSFRQRGWEHGFVDECCPWCQSATSREGHRSAPFPRRIAHGVVPCIKTPAIFHDENLFSLSWSGVSNCQSGPNIKLLRREINHPSKGICARRSQISV